MFRKRVKKAFPPGTFIPFPARFMAIAQLCIVFTLVLWQASLPFMHELFAVKSDLILYDFVIKNERFSQLTQDQQYEIQQARTALHQKLGQPFLEKIQRSIHAIFVEISPLELAWLFFSTTLVILVQLKKEGARESLWILPVLAFAYAVDNRLNGTPAAPSPADLLFPSEQVLIDNYLKTPLGPSTTEQRTQLKKGWELYLVDQWTQAVPADDEEHFKQQVAEGEFIFHTARLKVLLHEPKMAAARYPRQSLWLLALYVFWNLSVALVIWRSGKVDHCKESY